MTTPPGRPHPWSAGGPVHLTDPAPTITRRRPAEVTAEQRAATEARMLRDAHRSHDGRCVRCDTAWPCDVARSVA